MLRNDVRNFAAHNDIESTSRIIARSLSSVGIDVARVLKADGALEIKLKLVPANF